MKEMRLKQGDWFIRNYLESNDWRMRALFVAILLPWMGFTILTGIYDWIEQWFD